MLRTKSYNAHVQSFSEIINEWSRKSSDIKNFRFRFWKNKEKLWKLQRSLKKNQHQGTETIFPKSNYRKGRKPRRQNQEAETKTLAETKRRYPRRRRTRRRRPRRRDRDAEIEKRRPRHRDWDADTETPRPRRPNRDGQTESPKPGRRDRNAETETSRSRRRVQDAETKASIPTCRNRDAETETPNIFRNLQKNLNFKILRLKIET